MKSNNKVADQKSKWENLKLIYRSGENWNTKKFYFLFL